MQICREQVQTRRRNQPLSDIANRLEVCFGRISVVEGQNPASTATQTGRRFRECLIRAIRPLAIVLFLLFQVPPRCLMTGPAGCGRHGGSGQGDAGRRRGDRGEGNAGAGQGTRSARANSSPASTSTAIPNSKLYDLNKATPLLLDAAERGYVPAMLPIAGAYAEGKGVPKSLFEAYKWVAIAERWNAPVLAAVPTSSSRAS